MRKKLPTGQRVKFNIAQGMNVGEATIIDSRVENEDGKDYRYYRLDDIEGSQADMHRDETGELWVNDFEVRPVVK